jgi:hypothetical protein
MSFQLFHSHNWGREKSNHQKVMRLVQAMDSRGWVSWVDERNMVGDIGQAMISGIVSSSVFVVYLTKEYFEKVCGTKAQSPSNSTDNCKFEWDTVIQEQKIIVPVVMERSLIDEEWEASTVRNLEFHTHSSSK